MKRMMHGILRTLALALIGTALAWAQQDTRSSFDHLTTGFELVGQHRDLACESCHVKAKFKGTPHDCVACHGASTDVHAMAKPATHILSTDKCDACHTPVAWKPAVKFDHAEVRGSCSSCHNGVQAQGKGPTHIQTDLECDACHSTIGWAGAIFNHAGITSGCAVCHNNVSATGTPSNHIDIGSIGCEGCHSSSNFTTFAFPDASGTAPPSMVHSLVTVMACSACHEAGKSFVGTPPVKVRPALKANGAAHVAAGECNTCHFNTTSFLGAVDLPANHIPIQGGANANCAICHTTSDYSLYVMNHSVVIGSCAACHAAGLSFANMAPPTLKEPPTNHIPIGTAACEACHSPTNFTTFVIANKSPPMSHAAVAGVSCNTCHASGLSFVGSPATVVLPTNHIPIGTATCEQCHSTSNFTTFVIANTSPPMNHAAVASMACGACHSPGLSFIGTPATVLEPPNHIPVGTTACTNCHAASNFTSFVIANAVPPMNHAGFGTNCSVCHGSGLNFVGTPAIKALPPNHVPTASLACEGCHSSTNFNSFSFPNATGTAPPSMVHSVASAIACSTCHEAGLTFIGSPPTKTRPALKANGSAHVTTGECSDCHGTVTFIGANDYPTNHIPLPNGAQTNCSLCHSNPANYAIYVMSHTVVPGTACAVCHATGRSFANMAPPALKVPPGNHIPFGAAACESCHAPTDFSSFVMTNKSPPMNHAVVASMPCRACHSPGQSWVGSPATVVEVGTHVPDGTTPCVQCHLPTNFTSFVMSNVSGTAPPSMVHTGFGSNCISCHGAGLSFVGSPPVKPFPANHVPTTTIACEGCHSNSNFNTFAISNTSGTAPPSMVHTLVTASACSVCHEAGLSFVAPVKLRPALKANGQPHVPAGECSTCHFNTTSFLGATDLPANHIPLPAADNANCSLCHTTGNYSLYVMNHVNISSNCAQCHATGLSFANMTPPTLKVPPSNHVPFAAAACEACHSASNFNSFAITNKSPPMNHAVVASLTCNTCHAQGLTFVGTPATVVLPPNHIPTGSTACQNCHSASNFANFVIPNAVPPMNHTGFTTNCITCHGVGLSFVGTPAVKLFPPTHIPSGTIACEGCHSNSNFSTFVIPNASGAAPPSMLHTLVTSIACSVCHETGKSFIGTPAVKVRPALKANGQAHVPAGECNTCHFNTTSFLGATDLPANHIPLPAADNNNCVMCHTTGNYSLYVMNHANITNNCAQCHAAGSSFANMAPPTLKVPPTTPRAHIPFAAVACELCHTPTVFNTFAGTVMKHAAVRSMTCISCHEIGMNWLTNTGVRLWVRPSAGHHSGQDCGGSGCHSTRDKRGVRPGSAAALAGLKTAAATAPRADSITSAAITRAGGFDHRRVANQACVSCHDQASGIGKTASHMAASNQCASCHNSFAWLPVTRVDHSQVGGKCVSCHNGRIATGQSSRHFATADTCDSCHTTNAWAPARFEHAAAKPATCASCHDSVRAIGKPANHIPTTGDCGTCHAVLAWMPVKLDHSTLKSNCVSCHNGASATGRSSTHLVTQRDCSLCHNYPDWTAVSFTHASAAYPGDHRAALSCVSCHTSNTDQIPYASAANAGSCAGCHSANFKPDLHIKSADGGKYTVNELRNCSGACHVYTDSTLASVLHSLPGPYHRVSDAAFKH